MTLDRPAAPVPKPLVARAPGGPLTGRAVVPGDKSISHRALLLGALAEGSSQVTGLLEGADVLSTAAAMTALGVPVRRHGRGKWEICGGGLGALDEPDRPVDCGNAGTLARLLTGIVAANPLTVTLTGDASLSGRPMERVFTPMRAVGAEILAREGDRLPATIRGTARPLPVDWTLPVASAQVKSAILLAALHGPGETRIDEPVATRDHTERMLRRMGAKLQSEAGDGGGRRHALTGGSELAPLDFRVPADPSSAALVAAAALLVEGSDILLPGICVNPTRTGFFTTVAEMGAAIEFGNRREAGGEPVADLRVRQAPLRGVRVPADRAASMIDEYPALAVVAAVAAGDTVMEGVAELRGKESDRIEAMATGLRACGIDCGTEPDRMLVRGGGRVTGGVTLPTRDDHRVAMAFLVLAQIAAEPVTIDDGRAIDTSFPGFVQLLHALGGRVASAGGTTA